MSARQKYYVSKSWELYWNSTKYVPLWSFFAFVAKVRNTPAVTLFLLSLGYECTIFSMV